jgi:hypothetical protein
MRDKSIVVLSMSICAVACLLSFWQCVPAGAEISHNYLSSITEVPEGSGAQSTGPLSALNWMSTDAGFLWVAESIEGAGSRVDEFNEAGEFLAQLNEKPGIEHLEYGIAAGDESGESLVYVSAQDPAEANPGILVPFGAVSHQPLATWTGSDTPAGSFGEVAGAVAVDDSGAPGDWASGDVLVADSAQNVIDLFKPEPVGTEKYVTQITGPSTSEPGTLFESVGAIAIDDANGDVALVTGISAPVVDLLEPVGLSEYRLVQQIAGTSKEAFSLISSIAIEGATGELYVANQAEDAVDEFSLSGAYLGRVTGTPAGGFKRLRGIAVNSHHLYVGDAIEGAGVIDVFGPDVVLPDPVTGAAENAEPHSATLTGTVNPVEGGDAECVFDWGVTPGLGKTAPCFELVHNGPNPVPVEAALTELEPDTKYYYRLQASNHNGTNTGEGEILSFTTLGPALHEAWASEVTDHSATLSASIDAHGAPTSYYFEYGTSRSYGATVPAIGATAPRGAPVGSGEGDVTISQPVAELEADKSYHYRLVALSEVGGGRFEAFTMPDQAFTTRQVAPAAPALADGRRWELVSPSQKHGALIQGIASEGIVQAATDGEAITYVAGAPTEGEPEGNANGVQVLSTREPNGWSSRDIATAHDQATATVLGKGSEYPMFSTDLSKAVVEPHGPFTPYVGQESSPHATERTVYLRANFTCAIEPGTCYTPLVTAANVPVGTSFGGNPHELRGVELAGANAELSHVVVASSVPLAAPITESGGLYEWEGGRVQLVSIRPQDEGGPAAGNVWLGHYEASGKDVYARDAISSDGSRIVWTAREEGEQHLYMRDTATGESALLDVPQQAVIGTSEPLFQAASSSGSRVFFTDTQALIRGSEGNDLYMCEMVEVGAELSCRLTDLTLGTEPHDAAEVLGTITGASEEGTYVYFVATGRLAAGATAGADNLYVTHESGGQWVTTFIATLSGEDNPDWAGQGVKGLAGLTSRVSPNGRYVAFMSQADLTGYDNHDAVSGMPDEEVYLYDAVGNRLTCASCDPTGARPTGVETDPNDQERLVEGAGVWPHGTWMAANVPGWTPREANLADYQARYLSNSGRLFFNSSDSLVPQDVNGTEDVYEYEPVGVGDCTAATTGYEVTTEACIGLISSGTSSDEAALLDASESGADVFFLTSGALVPQDHDDSPDVYDAHECTSSVPCLPEAQSTPTPCTSEDTCRAANAPQPNNFAAFGTAAFSGDGNAPPVVPPAKAKLRPLTRAQKLTHALKVCRKRPKRRRAACERQARGKHGAVKTGKRAVKARSRSADRGAA